MARSLRIEFEDAFYHIIQRGIEKNSIFITDADKEKFLSYLDNMHTSYGVIVHTYVLMSNHYHMILQTPQPNLSKAMHYLNTGYAVYFNTKRKRVGPLYQGRYKAILVQQDEYLHHLSRYIHLNPVRINLMRDPIEYRWSSYKYFVTSEPAPRWLNTALILSMFDKEMSKAKDLYRQFVLDGVGNEKDIIDENMITSFILGNAPFLKKLEGHIKSEENYEIPGLQQLKRMKEASLDLITHVVKKHTSHNDKKQRKLAIYLSRKLTQKTLKEIARFYGKIGYTGVSEIVRRMEKKRRKDEELNKTLDLLEKEIKV